MRESTNGARAVAVRSRPGRPFKVSFLSSGPFHPDEKRLPRGRPIDGVCLTVLLILALVLRGSLVSSSSFDLHPRPDALEYSAVARSLATSQGFTLELDGLRYPSRYPFGTSLVLLPAVLIAGGDAAFGFLAVFVLGLLSIAMTFLLARRLCGSLGAFVGALVVVLSPRHAVHCTLPMSEVPSAFFLLLLTLYFLHWNERQSSQFHLAVMGVIAAFSASIRWPNLLISLPILSVVLFDARLRWSIRARRGLMFSGFVALGLLFEFYYRQELLGSSSRTGYHFWEPDCYESWRTSYNPAFLFRSARNEWAFGNLEFYARGLSGFRPVLWTSGSAALAFLGVVCRRRWLQPLTRFLLIVPAATVVFYLPYFFRDQRMNLVVIPFLACFTGWSFEWLVSRLGTQPSRWLAGAVLLGAVCLGIGGDGGVIGQCAEDLALARRLRPQALHPWLLQECASLKNGSVVVADLARLQVEPYLPEGVTMINLLSDGADGEVRLIYKHDLRSLPMPDSSAHRRPRALFVDGKVDADVLRFLKEAALAGARIECWTTPRTDGDLFRIAEELGRHFEVEPLNRSEVPLRRGRLRPIP